ncbi:MAG: hypothetical protein A2020_07435 [Lentisphaerae bacterium GWF2_45_14]|nr:MAG: hypothetical protein A2020_07435 [Lentisphaerae bacterium GWF2_45_14]
MNIYVLGATGFLGKNIMSHFKQRKNYGLYGFSSNECDLLSTTDIKSCLSSLDENSVIIFTSAITRIIDNSYNSLSKNLNMVMNLCSFLNGRKIAQIIYLSTIDVYGLVGDDEVITENTLPQPNDNYSLSKLASEFILRQEADRAGYPLCVFRLPGVYGSGDNGKSAISSMVLSAVNNESITINGDGSNLRDFINARDVCEAVEVAFIRKINNVINLASGCSYSIKDISKIILRKLDIPEHNIIFQPLGKFAGIAKRVKHLRFDNLQCKNLLPDIKFVKLDNGISEYLINSGYFKKSGS